MLWSACHCAFILYSQSALCPQNHMPKHTVTEMKITHQQTFKQKPPWTIWPHLMLAFTGADGESEERIGQMARRWKSGAPADNACGSEVGISEGTPRL